MGGVSAIVYCPACNTYTAEVAYLPENWEGWKRFCHMCQHQGLEITAISTTNEWTRDPDSVDSDGDGS